MKIKPIKISKHLIGSCYPCFIIAEMSANHNKNFKNALRIIDAAKEAGADAVKVQTYTPDTMTINSHKKWFRITSGLWKGYTLYDLYKEAYMPWDWQFELKKHADKIGIAFFSTAFDNTSVDFLQKLKVPVHKIASFELTHIPLLEYIAKKGKPIILSTGMARLGEVDTAIAVLRKNGCKQIILMKCTSAYPAKPEEMNIRSMDTLSARYKLPVGLSDHSINPQVALTAVARGAVVLEKHFTLKRSIGGADAAFSLEPQEMKALIKEIRTVEAILGKNYWGGTNGEKENIIFRRSIFTSKPIAKGERFTENNIKIVRPGYGAEPTFYKKIIGSINKRNLAEHEPVMFK